MDTLKKEKDYIKFCDDILLIVLNVSNKEKGMFHLDSPISQLGIDSIAVTKIIFIINSIFKLELSPVILYGHKTVKDIANDLYMRFEVEINAVKPSSQSVGSFCEQYLGNHKESQETFLETVVDRDYLLVFSAANKDLLVEYLRHIICYLEENMEEPNLIKNLEVELMSVIAPEAVRLAIMVKDSVNLLIAIKDFVSGQFNNQIYTGEVIAGSNYNINLFVSCDEAKIFLKNSFLSGDIKKVAALWSLGVEMDWSVFYLRNKCHTNIAGNNAIINSR